MHLAGLPTTYAPHTTGHPLGLPETQSRASEKTRVAPITKRGDTDAASTDGRPPGQFWRSANGEPDPSEHVAPPSIMQIKISRMLEEQHTAMTAPEGADDTTAKSIDGNQGTADTAIAGVWHEAPTAQHDGQASATPEERSPRDDATSPPDAPPRLLPAYDETASMSRNAVLSTLP